MSRTRLVRRTTFLSCAVVVLLAWGCGDDGNGGGGTPAEPGSISGTFTYDGSETGTHALTVAVMTHLTDPLSVVVTTGFAVSDVQLAAGYDYAVTDVPPGTYYVSGFWDVNDNLSYDEGIDAGFTYGGTVSPATVDVLAGLETAGIDIVLE